MTDEELIARLREIQGQAGLFASEAADRIEQLVKDKRWIMEERDRTFALMLARAEAAEARVAELEAAIDSQDANEAGLWRFWSHKASELATKNAQLMQAGAKAEAQIAALTARVERLTGAAKRVLAPLDEPCRHDHHGYCQTHFVEAECSVAALRAALSATTEASQ